MYTVSRRSMRIGGLEIGLDTLTGVAVILAAMWRRKCRGRPPVPTWLRGDGASEEETNACIDAGAEPAREKLRLLGTGVVLMTAPLLFSALSPMLEAVVYTFAIFFPLTESSLLGARLLVEQSLLYFALCKLVHKRHPDFFTKRWVRWSLRGPWLLPVLGGYSASIALFNLVEPINQWLLPHLAYTQEGMVSKLANPLDKLPSSLLLAAITPCVGAPMFEELQSRVFVLQALASVMPLRGALALSGLLFGAQHFQIGLLLPLSVTGFFWGVLYVNSANLLVPILVHALWNARIFLGSYLGL